MRMPTPGSDVFFSENVVLETKLGGWHCIDHVPGLEGILLTKIFQSTGGEKVKIFEGDGFRWNLRIELPRCAPDGSKRNFEENHKNVDFCKNVGFWCLAASRATGQKTCGEQSCRARYGASEKYPGDTLASLGQSQHPSENSSGTIHRFSSLWLSISDRTARLSCDYIASIGWSMLIYIHWKFHQNWRSSFGANLVFVKRHAWLNMETKDMHGLIGRQHKCIREIACMCM